MPAAQTLPRMSESADQPATSPSQGGTARGVLPLLFIVSMATITLQVVQVRIFSYTINHAFVYLAISLAMLGFGASGTFLSVARGLLRVPAERSVSACLLLFALSAVGVHAYYARNSYTIIPQDGLTIWSRSALLLVAFAIPYFFAGLAVALALLSDAANLGRNYFVNLVGSAAGCFAVYPFLPEVGAHGVVLGVALACGLSVLVFGPGFWRLVAAVASALLLSFFLLRDLVLPFRPDVSDQFTVVQQMFTQHAGIEGGVLEPELEYERWDPVGKIEIFRWPEPYSLFAGTADSRFFVQDAGAGSVLFDLREHPAERDVLVKGTLYGIATQLRPEADVLVVGLGGGPDLIATLANGARHVTGVEINQGTLEVLGREYREYLGLPDPAGDRLDLLHADGRSFVRSAVDRFDVIQMTGADTNAASASGGSILVENYLYTLEAFVDYLRAIKPDGVVSITRFGQEPNRVVTTMLEALDQLGIDQPERCIAVVNQSTRWGCVLVKRVPFTDDELATLEAICVESAGLAPRATIPVYDPIGFQLTDPSLLIYPERAPGNRQYVYTLRERVEQILAREDGDYTPCTDDKPFFFNFAPQTDQGALEKLGGILSSVVGGQRDDDEQPGFGVTDYLVMSLQFTLVALVLILLPLFALKRSATSLRAAAPLAVYFLGIGVGFMFLELVLMQKCGLFVGHPNRSISTVLFALLVSSGLGSWISGRWGARPGVKIGLAMVGVAIWIVLFSTFSQALFEQFLSAAIPVRIAILVAVIAPAGLLLGMPFPTCLRLVDERLPAFAPWAMAANGFASVVASLAAIPTSMSQGFSASLVVALVAYACAGLAFLVFARQAR